MVNFPASHWLSEGISVYYMMEECGRILRHTPLVICRSCGKSSCIDLWETCLQWNNLWRNLRDRLTLKTNRGVVTLQWAVSAVYIYINSRSFPNLYPCPKPYRVMSKNLLYFSICACHHVSSLRIFFCWGFRRVCPMETTKSIAASSTNARMGHANLLCIVPILSDDPRRESISCHIIAHCIISHHIMYPLVIYARVCYGKSPCLMDKSSNWRGHR